MPAKGATSKVKKVVLAYSGGLDTSIILKWLQETYGCEVVTFTADLGQGEELEPARRKAEMLGIKKENIFIEDLREEFVRDYVFPMFRANAALRGRLPARHLDRAAADRQEADRDRPADRRRRRLPRRHRQGQRPGALRAHLLRAGAVHQDHRALARVGLQEPRAADRIRREAPDPGRQGQARRGALLGRRQPSALLLRRQGAGGSRRSSRRPMSTSARSRRWRRPTRRTEITVGFAKGDAVSLDGKKLSPANLLAKLNDARPRQRHRPPRPGREPLRRHEVARRLRDAGRHHPARRASRHGIDHARPRRRAPQGRADAALRRADLQRLLVLHPSARCCRR